MKLWRSDLNGKLIALVGIDHNNFNPSDPQLISLVLFSYIGNILAIQYHFHELHLIQYPFF